MDKFFGLSYEAVRDALRGERLPCAIVDLAAFDANAAKMAAIAGAANPAIALRVATKSVRCPELLRRILASDARYRGLMTFSAAETSFLSANGFDDFLLAYPTLARRDLDALAALSARGATLGVMADCRHHLEQLSCAARDAATEMHVLIDVDMSFRPGGGSVHLGVRRSPIRNSAQAVALARAVEELPHLRLAGIMAYEAQIAGLTDRNPFAPRLDAAKRLFKHLSRRDVQRRRHEVTAALRDAGFALPLVNGGGTGSLRSTSRDASVTECTVGSGFFCPHLFDYYREIELQPAAFFALQAVRYPAAGFVTCRGGGYVASGATGADRLPIPVLPEGLELLAAEGAGEVQTPLRVGRGSVAPALGDPVIFRHAKAGELCEHFAELLLVRDGQLVDRVATYRGLRTENK